MNKSLQLNRVNIQFLTLDVSGSQVIHSCTMQFGERSNKKGKVAKGFIPVWPKDFQE